MKTLLLSLVVVTFVCLDLAHTRTCYSCTENICLQHEQCQDGQDVCYKRWNTTYLILTDVVRGCAKTCPTPIEEEEVYCCLKDNCN
uniref:Toxin 3FTx-Lei1 n=1 Tax=Leioheterodon madagascariensis TaxID=46577 RepID=3NX1_LEIMD|nr:RecName: Full=Toxin 3FTx-Lei1; Flags: Precursor [Leioheterodon madagascariensis]ABU68476.1 3FTx-Lei1 [Leioheterodon madagascariensis]